MWNQKTFLISKSTTHRLKTMIFIIYRKLLMQVTRHCPENRSTVVSIKDNFSLRYLSIIDTQNSNKVRDSGGSWGTDSVHGSVLIGMSEKASWQKRPLPWISSESDQGRTCCSKNNMGDGIQRTEDQENICCISDPKEIAVPEPTVTVCVCVCILRKVFLYNLQVRGDTFFDAYWV